METIIGLLFILLPVIFKLIEKNLQKAGKEQQAGKVRELADLFKEDETSSAYEGDESAFEESEEPMAAPVIELPLKPETAPASPARPVKTVKPAPLFVEGQKMTRKKKAPILVEEPEINKKEKIDPKKMVIYSEIMKPKYQD